MREGPVNLARIGRTFRNGFRSEGARLFGWRFTRDYLAVAWQSARRWGATDAGTLEVAGCRIEYFDRSDALFLLHEIFVNASYGFTASSPAPRIIDGGANIGMATLFFKALYPACSIVAVEPAPATFKRLTENVSRNHLRDVTLLNAAIAETPGTTAIHAGSAPGSLVASIAPPALGDPYHVRAITLSSLLDEPADFVKLDVEGAEYGVIREVVASGRLGRIRQLVLEYHESDARAIELESTIAALRAAGMHVDRRDHSGSPTGILRVLSTAPAAQDQDRAAHRE